ncbi:RND family efflux transporter MFP subunit [Kineococcus xinjiangensis]|uniref:RND family efflux transporter MFP subunit n=1 Tax=Kineococcus xinjiangensis TaxID=512762 RepID=A0A2S6IKH6_9ACTN|nr:RND family efflux transporter MFP subunit [Kineococcus xinjiangensis]
MLLATLVSGCSEEEGVAVRTATVERGDVVEIVEAPGTIVPRAAAVLTAPAAGTVATLSVSDGQEVHAGQEILVIESPDARDALARAQAADAQAARSARTPAPGRRGTTAEQRRAREEALRGFADARARAEQIPDEAARTQALAALDAARAQYDLLSAQSEQLAGQVEAGLASVGSALSSLGQAQRVQTRAAVEAAQRVVDSLVVRAPIAGRVWLAGGGGGGGGAAALPPGAAGLLAAGGVQLPDAGDAGGASAGPLTEGTPVAAGARLAVVVDASTLSVTADIDETDVLQVRPGTGADLSLDAVPDADYGATVTAVDPEPSPGNGGAVSYTARMTFDGGTLPGGEPAPAPLPGMSAVVSLRVREAPQALRVPASAVLRAEAGRSEAVWVVEDGRAQRRDVSVGARGEESVEVLSGLREGETVAVSGLDALRDGAEVP